MRADHPFRRAFGLLGGSATGQAVALLLAPLLTRLYDPAAFGVLGLFVALTTLVASVASFGLDQAILLETDPLEARRACGAALLLAAAIAGLGVATGLVLRAASLLGPLDCAIVLLISVSVLLLAAAQILTARALSLDRPRAVAASRFLRAVSVGAVQLGLAPFLPRNGFVLVLGAVLGQLACLLVMLGWLRDAPRPVLGGSGAIAALLRRHHTLLAFSTPQTLLNNAGNALVPTILLRQFGAAIAGGFALASRVTLLPAITLGDALRQSLLLSMSRRAGRPDARAALAGRATLLLALTLAPAALLAFVVAPALFAIVFGAPWRVAGVEAAWLFLAQAAGIANIPALTVITVRRWQRAHLNYQVVTIPLRLASLLAAGHWLGPVEALACYCTLSALASIGLTLAVLRALAARPAGLATQALAPA